MSEPVRTLAAKHQPITRREARIPRRRLLLILHRILLQARPTNHTSNIAPRVITLRLISHTLRRRRKDITQTSTQVRLTKEAIKDMNKIRHLMAAKTTVAHITELRGDILVVYHQTMGPLRSSIRATVTRSTAVTVHTNKVTAVIPTWMASSTVGVAIDLP